MQKQQLRSVFCGIVRLIAIGMFVVIADSVQAANSNGPYYAEPSWDQKLPAATRFVVLMDWNNEAVLDRETGLVWEQAPAGGTTATWDNIRSACITRVIGGRKGWRLPSVLELASLVDPSVPFPGPSLPTGHPFTGIVNAGFWSTSTVANVSTHAWVVDFRGGPVISLDKTFSRAVWCVRGANSADVY